MMHEMTLEEFYKNLKEQKNVVMNMDDYNLNIIYFDTGAPLIEEDNDYFQSRIREWKEFKMNHGCEPFFHEDEPYKIAGVVRFGLIQD